MKPRPTCLLGALGTLLLAGQAHAQMQVACVGDSITNGGNPDNAYPTYLGDELGAEYAVTNCGRSGALLTSNAPRAGDYYAELPEFEACKTNVPSPDIVTIMLGTNDSGYWDTAEPNYESEYLSLVDEFKLLNPDVLIIAVTPPHALDYWRDGIIQGAVIRDEITPLVKSIAAEQGYAMADINTATTDWFTGPDLMTWDPTVFADDGVHPNATGAQELAGLFADAIREAVANPPGSGGMGGEGGMSGAGGMADGGGAGDVATGGVGGASGGAAGQVAQTAGAGGDVGAAGSTTASAPSSDDSSCSVGRNGTGGTTMITGLLLAAFGLLRRQRGV